MPKNPVGVIQAPTLAPEFDCATGCYGSVLFTNAEEFMLLLPEPRKVFKELSADSAEVATQGTPCVH